MTAAPCPARDRRRMAREGGRTVSILKVDFLRQWRSRMRAGRQRPAPPPPPPPTWSAAPAPPAVSPPRLDAVVPRRLGGGTVVTAYRRPAARPAQLPAGHLWRLVALALLALLLWQSGQSVPPPPTTPVPQGAAAVVEPPPAPPLPPRPASHWVAVAPGQAALLYAEPGGERWLTALTNGARVALTGAEREIDGERWVQVLAPDGQAGWLHDAALVPADTP